MNGLNLPFDNCTEDDFMVLSGPRLMDVFVNKGILLELNRSFLHPIGLSASFTDDGLTIYSTDNADGFLFDQIDMDVIKRFMEFRNKKTKERQSGLGFLIQTKNLYASEKINEFKVVNPKEGIYTLLLKCLSNVHGDIVSEFARMLNTIDADDPDTVDGFMFSYIHLEDILISFAKAKNWRGVHLSSLLLENYYAVKEELLKLKTLLEERKENDEQYVSI